MDQADSKHKLYLNWGQKTTNALITLDKMKWTPFLMMS